MFYKLTCCGLLCIFLLGCGDHGNKMQWRRDIAPIVRRIPLLSSASEMLWNGKIVTKHSLFSPPGPSTYRICCFLPKASLIIPSLLEFDYQIEELCDNAIFADSELEVLKEEYGINTNLEGGIINTQITNQLVQSPYWGQCIYFKTQDVLVVILYGE